MKMVEKQIKKPSSVEITNESYLPVKFRLLKTIVIFSVQITLGIAGTVLGPTLLDIAQLYDTAVERVSLVFIGHNLGYLLGALFCTVIYDRIRQELQISIASLVNGLLVSIAPWCFNLELYFFVISCHSVAIGFLDSACQAYCVYLWMGDKKLEPIMQGLHLAWSLASMVNPFLLQPFLSPRLKNATNVSAFTNAFTNTSVVTENSMFYENRFTENFTDNELSFYGPTKVQYGYLTIGCVIALIHILTLIIYIIDKPDLKHRQNMQFNENNIVSKTISASLKAVMLSLVVLFYIAYQAIEVIPGSLLPSYLVEALYWEKNTAASSLSVFYGFLGLGRLLSIALATFLAPQHMIWLNITITIAAFAVFYIGSLTNTIIVWIGIAFIGLGLSSIFASGVLWISYQIEFKGFISGVVMMSNALSSIATVPLTAFLFLKYADHWFIIIPLVFALALALIFFVMTLVVKIYVKKP